MPMSFAPPKLLVLESEGLEVSVSLVRAGEPGEPGLLGFYLWCREVCVKRGCSRRWSPSALRRAAELQLPTRESREA